jgi:hypothetical protein
MNAKIFAGGFLAYAYNHCILRGQALIIEI